MTKPIRTGIVGTGFMSRVHARAVQASGGALVGFVGSSPQRAEDAAAGHPGARAFGSIDELLSEAPDVVHICTPNHLHRKQAEAVLAAGVAVVCEKPLATSVADAARLVALAERSGAVAAVPFVYRFYASVQEIRSRISSGGSGGPWLLQGGYVQDWLARRSDLNWRVDPSLGGASRAFGDIGVHWCDLMEYVTGQRIARLNARLGTAFEREGGPSANATEDGGVIMFETDSGAIGSLAVSQVSAGRKNRLWFSFEGPERSYSFDQEQPESFWEGSTAENKTVVRDPSSQHLSESSRRNALPAGHPQGYQHCFDDFVGEVHAALADGRGGGYPTFADGLRAALITDAVLESAKSRSWAGVPAPIATGAPDTPAAPGL